MSQQNIELVRRAFEGDLMESADAYWHPQIEVLGDEADITITVEDVFDAGERQVPFVRFRGHARSSGIPFEHLWGYVVEVRDERIAYLRAYYEPRKALAAAGSRSRRWIRPSARR